MSQAPLATVLQHLRSRAGMAAARDLSDAQLLQRFAATREEAAFAALVQRHGPLVLGVCRHVLRNAEDAEDAFQATFLVLARKAVAIRQPGSVGSWLYGVAHRIALKARASAVRRQGLVPPALPRPGAGPVAESALRELQAILDEEVARLPEKYRAPFVLCCLEGKSKPEAAHELGWKEGTVAGRLAQAREWLRLRLARRGVALAAALCAGALGQTPAVAAVPAGLAVATVQRAPLVASGQMPAVGLLSPQAAALVRGTLQTMAAGPLRVVLACILTLGVVIVTGLGLLTSSAPTGPAAPARPRPDEPRPPATGSEKEKKGAAPPLVGNSARFPHDAEVAVVVFSPDGKLLASADRSHAVVRVWDAATGKELGPLVGHTTPVSTIAFSPKGGLIASGDARDIRLWQTATGKEVRRFTPGPIGRVRTLAFSRDGKRLASGSDDHTVRLWEVDAGKLLFQSQLSSRPIPVLAFLGNDRVLAAASDDRTFWLVDVPTGKIVRKVADQPQRVVGIALSPDGQHLASISRDHLLWLGDMAAAPSWHQLDGPARATYAAAFAPDGKILASGDGDGWLDLLDVVTGKLIRRMGRHRGRVSAVAFSSDGKRLATGGADGLLRLWDAATGREVLPP